jgi:hypothetical protein
MAFRGFLTDDERATIDATVARWRAVGQSVDACDRPAAEAAVAAAYKAAGLVPPTLVVWMDSPYGGMLAARAIRGRLGLRQLAVLLSERPGTLQVPDVARRALAQLKDQLPDGWGSLDAATDPWIDREAVQEAVSGVFYGSSTRREVLWEPLGARLQSALTTALGGPLSFNMWDDEDEDSTSVDFWRQLQERLAGLKDLEIDIALAVQLTAHLQAPKPGGAGDFRVYDIIGVSPDPESVVFWKEFGGYLDPWSTAPILAAFDCAARVIDLPPFPDFTALRAAAGQVARWWPMAEAVVLTDRPVFLDGQWRAGIRPEDWNLDEDTVLAYADGYRVRE